MPRLDAQEALTGARIEAMDDEELRRAALDHDVGAAMDGRGTDAAQDASDVVPTDDDFATIARAVLRDACTACRSAPRHASSGSGPPTRPPPSRAGQGPRGTMTR